MELREEIPLSTSELMDELLRRLGLEHERGRIEIEFEGGQMRKLWRHLFGTRADYDGRPSRSVEGFV